MEKIRELIEIPLEEYTDLVVISARVDCLRRMLEAGEYVSTGEIMAVLDLLPEIVEVKNEADGH